MSTCLPTGQQSKAAARKDRIKNVARRLFVENGFHATGMAAIAKESGVLVGQIYRDFPSKDDIIAAIVAQDCANFADRATLERAIAADDRKGIRDWIMAVTADDDGDRESDRMFLEIIAEASRNERIATIFADVRHTVGSNMKRALGALSGTDPDDDNNIRLADAFMVISLGAVYARTMFADYDNHASALLTECLLERS